jgi:WD40 repeat protein
LDGIKSATFCPNEDYILLAKDEGSIELVHVDSGESLEMVFHGDNVNTAMYSHSGSLIVTASDDHTINIIDSETWEVVRTLIGHNDGVSIAVFSPDDKYVVSGAKNGVLKIWDVDSGLEIKELKGHIGRILTIDFNSDQNSIVTSSWDETVRIWSFPPLQDLVDQTRERFKDRPLTPEERHQYYLE